jgi:hypothetical protein
MASNTIWTTESVNQTLEQLRFGADVNMDCFHQRDPELKASNVLFQLTEEEEGEFIKCSQDINYFVEKYCQFLTDYGRKTVELRDFQRDILNTIGEEVWIDILDDFGPKVRNYILMASRQTGKCLSFDTQLNIKVISTDGSNETMKKITIGELYYIINKHFKNPSKTLKQKIILKIKTFLYNMYKKLNKQ